MARSATRTVILMTLPERYARILELEARRYEMKKSHFATQLFRRSQGLEGLEARRPDAPEYAFREDEMGALAGFNWSLSTEMAALVHKVCIGMGHIRPATLLVMLLRLWLGLDPLEKIRAKAA